MLLRFDRSPVVLLNRAIALAEVSGPADALAEVDGLRERLRDYHLLHATRAQLLASLGRDDEAREANLRALSLTGNPAERELLLGRIGHMGS
jgi:Predicted RNA polymerase sigma factor containing a TPR repeat domain